MDEEAVHAELFRKLYHNRVRAHEVLFRHRHPNETQAFHREMIRKWHDKTIPKDVELAFRGSAKSTIAEEAITIMAGFREFKNILIVGETSDRACDRLLSIRREIEQNDKLREVYGDLIGPTWADGELVLSNGVRLLAVGRGQSLRGIKYEDMRPDAVFVDDVEDEESVADPKRREKLRRWFFAVLLPACDPSVFIRVAATPLDPDALAVRLIDEEGWSHSIYPIEYLDENGERCATWPDRFPLKKIDELRKNFTRQGLFEDFEREYMCAIRSSKTKTFPMTSIKVEPRVRTWQAVYAMFDPARTTNKASATTGFAAWSWIGTKLVVWDAWGRQILPDEIVSSIFDVALSEALPPVWIGVEEDGLNEFLLQPIRTEQVRRGVAIPFRAMRAPRGKLDFIAGLQPYFRAGQVIFAKELPDLKDQLLSFPTGKIDVPNALAYALKLKPGAPIHEHFGNRHIVEDLRRVAGKPYWLVAHAARGLVGAALVQYADGALYVLADWIREGGALEVFSNIVSEACLEAGRSLRVIVPSNHYNQYNNVGLVQAAKRIPMEVQRGYSVDQGGAILSDMLQRESRGFPAVRISANARWTLNALAGGYCRSIDKSGTLTQDAEVGPYRIIMEAIHSFIGLSHASAIDGPSEGNVGYAWTANGRRYLTAMR